MTRQDTVRVNLKKIDPFFNYPKNSIGFSKLFAEVYKDFCRYNRQGFPVISGNTAGYLPYAQLTAPMR